MGAPRRDAVRETIAANGALFPPPPSPGSGVLTNAIVGAGAPCGLLPVFGQPQVRLSLRCTSPLCLSERHELLTFVIVVAHSGQWEDRVLLPGKTYNIGRCPVLKDHPPPPNINEDGSFNLWYPFRAPGLSRTALTLTVGPAPSTTSTDTSTSSGTTTPFHSFQPSTSSTSWRTAQIPREFSDIDGHAAALPPLLHATREIPADAPELNLHTVSNPTATAIQSVSVYGRGDAVVVDPEDDRRLIQVQTLRSYAPYNAEPREHIDDGSRTSHTLRLGHRDMVRLACEAAIIFRWEPMIFGVPPLRESDAFAIQQEQATALGMRMLPWDTQTDVLNLLPVTCHLVMDEEVTRPSKARYIKPVLLGQPMAKYTYLSRCIDHIKQFLQDPNKQWRGWPAIATKLPPDLQPPRPPAFYPKPFKGYEAQLEQVKQADALADAQQYDERPSVQLSDHSMLLHSLFDTKPHDADPLPPSPLPRDKVEAALKGQWARLCAGGVVGTLQGFSLVWICHDSITAQTTARSAAAVYLRLLGARLLVCVYPRSTTKDEVATNLTQWRSDHRLVESYEHARSRSVPQDIDVIPHPRSYLPPGGTAVYLDPSLTQEQYKLCAQGANAYVPVSLFAVRKD